MLSRLSFKSAGLLALATLLVFGAGRITAQNSAPQTPAAPQAAVLGSGFTYQGQLKQNGSSVNAVCDFQFGLWDALSGGNQWGATQTIASVSVSGGLFTVTLNGGDEFGTDTFRGDERYIETAVRCPAGSGAYTSLTPRQSLTAVPYALGLRPGAQVNSFASGNAAAFTGISFASTGRGLAGVANSNDGFGGYFFGNGGTAFPGAAIFADGDAKQPLDDSGFVKAAVKAVCGDTGSAILQSYNAINTTTISNGPFPGFCTINFGAGFDVTARFIQVTAYSGTGGARGATLNGVTGTTADFIRYVPNTGLGENGIIYVLVY